MVFVRALTSSICQALKIDAQPILEKLPKAALPLLNHDDVAINTPIGAASSSKSSWCIRNIHFAFAAVVFCFCALLPLVFIFGPIIR